MVDTSWLAIDAEREIERITETLRTQVRGELRRKGLVVGISGGIDSSVTAALAVRAFGSEGALGIAMPESATSDDALVLGRELADAIGLPLVVEDLRPALEGLGCYARADEAIRKLVPEYGPGWKHKLVIPSILDSDRLNITRLVVQSPTGETQTIRPTAEVYRQVVAATNFKQRTRAMMEYYHADRLGFAVAGTPNLLEYDQGFFVKHGDGAADVKPIAHLYKTQVYALAAALGVPASIRSRTPTTDTFSLPQTQEEFYFALPYQAMDVCLYGKNEGRPLEEIARAVGITVPQVERVMRDIEAKRRVAEYLHSPPLLVPPREA